MAITTSVCMPDELYDQYKELTRVTRRSRNELLIEALRSMAERQIHEIAMIQEGLDQSRARLGIPIEDAIAQFVAEGILPAGFRLDGGAELPSA